MQKITIKIPAKVNITLDVKGEANGYHDVNSLVTSVNVYDAITISKRKDNVIKLTCVGLPIGCESKKNNAYITAKLLRDKFSLGGVNIAIEKNIPVGGGMGGSSADVAGVIIAYKKLYDIKENLIDVASQMGSDVPYMLKGGYAILKGRGDRVEFLENVNLPLYFIFAKADKSVTARECYKKFDMLSVKGKSTTNKCVKSLLNGDGDGVISCLHNDLFLPAKILLPEIETNYYCLSKVGNANMTGSGSVTYAVFLDKQQRDLAYKKLLPLFQDKIFKGDNQKV